MYKNEIKIDRSTLPKDDQLVKFDTNDESDLIGLFSEGDDLFVINSHKWYTSYQVVSWEPLDE
jgi:hypothetical protein